MESVDGHSSSTTPPVCTTKGGENGRRKVHEVAEQHDDAGVERRQQIPVQFATAYNSKRTSKQMRKLPARKRWSLLDRADFAWCYMQARSSTWGASIMGGADLMLRGRGATRTCWPTEPLSAELLKAHASLARTQPPMQLNRHDSNDDLRNCFRLEHRAYCMLVSLDYYTK